MKTLRVQLAERSYSIEIGAGALAELGRLVAQHVDPSSAIVVTDENVARLYAERATQSLESQGIRCAKVVLPAGEEGKGLGTVSRLLDEIFDIGIDRRSAVVALGGGVVGDVAGFAAAVALRGVDYVQVPTTLLAQVDSSVGGKTGVNHATGKNLIGAFWQPRLVVIDPASLETLPRRELLAGVAEVVKYGVIWDAELFGELEERHEALLALDESYVSDVVARCCEIKAEVVSRDEREGGLRAILNFGHTVGHAIENDTGYGELLHGEAVSIGMVAAGRLAASLGMWAESEAGRLESLLERFGLPISIPGRDPARIRELMTRDKKTRGGTLRMVLPERMGSVTVVDAPDEALLARALKGIF